MVALLGFGYRLALYVYQRGLTGFLGQVTRFVVDFVLHHCIARWIAQRGGWVSAPHWQPPPCCRGCPSPGPTQSLRVCVHCQPLRPLRLSWQVAALDLGNGPIRNVLIVLAVVLLGQFVVRRFFKS